MKVKIPREIKFLTHTYRIKVDGKALLSAGTTGLARHIYKDILLNGDLPPSELNQTLLHELLHIVERFMVVKLDDNDIDRLAEGLAVLLFDNLGIELDWSNIEGAKRD